MKYRNCVYTMAAALLVAGSLAVSGCSDKKKRGAGATCRFLRRGRFGDPCESPSEIQYIFPPRD